jgi:hypothetical protein
MRRLKYIILLIFINVFISCFTHYGSPNSPFVDIVGRDLDNFVEYEKEGTASIDGKGYTIVYFKKTYDKGDGSYLFLKKLSDKSEKLIFQGNLGHEIEFVFINKNLNHLYYTFVDIRNDFDKAYLVTYDLNKMEIISKTVIMDEKKYDKGQFLGGGGYIDRCIYDENQNRIFIKIYYNLEDSLYYDGKDFISYDINTGIVKEISENEYNALLVSLRIPEDSFSYISGNVIKKLFIISPYSDYLPANYKNKYNGIYIYDGKNNIRISKLHDYSFYSAPVNWIENSDFIIWDSYLFGTSGKLKENKIVDGTVLAIYQ